jgi:hypothetical protein
MSVSDDTLFVDGVEALFWKGRSFAWNLISTRLTQFPYFDEVLGRPVWRGRKVLDFGGNVGTFLRSADGNVDHEDYWCLDLNAAVIEQGRRTYPRANFVHYNRYNSQYNPHGVRHLPIPDCGLKFDIILAFSVFTHTDLSEMVELVTSLRRMLATGGLLAFTFIDQHYDRSLVDPKLPRGSTFRRELGFRGEHEIVGRSRWLVVIDRQLYLEPGQELSHQRRVGKPLESYCSFFRADFVASLFPDAMIHPPISGEWQHCCILKKAD